MFKPVRISLHLKGSRAILRLSHRSRKFLQRSGVMEMNHIQAIVELVRRVRHDANNPITAALGHVQLLLDDPAVQDEEVRESLRVVEGELRRLIDILKRLNEVRADGPPPIVSKTERPGHA